MDYFSPWPGHKWAIEAATACHKFSFLSQWQGEIVENGMFYFARRELIEQGLLQGGHCGYVETPQEYSIEIDSAFDLAFAEQVASQDYIQLFM